MNHYVNQYINHHIHCINQSVIQHLNHYYLTCSYLFLIIWIAENKPLKGPEGTGAGIAAGGAACSARSTRRRSTATRERVWGEVACGAGRLAVRPGLILHKISNVLFKLQSDTLCNLTLKFMNNSA